MEEIDFLKSGNKKKKASSSKKDVDMHQPDEGKKKKSKKEKKPKKGKKEKKAGFFSSLFKSKPKKQEPKKKPEKKSKKIDKKTNSPSLSPLRSAPAKQGPTRAETPVGLTPEEKEKISEILKEVEAKPKKTVPVKKAKPEKKSKEPESPDEGKKKEEATEKTIEKIKNGEIPLAAVDVNLIPKELLAELKPEKKIINLVWIGFATSLLVVVVYAALFYLQSTYLSQTEVNHQKIEALEDEIISYRPIQKQVEEYNESIVRINSLLEQHIYWNVFFDMLEQYTLPNVYYTSLSGNTTGTFTFTASAPDYKTITNQIEVLKQAENFVDNIEVTSATAVLEEEQIQTVNFNITLQVDPGIFMKNKSKIDGQES